MGWVILTALLPLIVVINMIVAVLLVHTAQLLALNPTGGWALELQGFYLFTAIAITLLGAGSISLGGRNGAEDRVVLETTRSLATARATPSESIVPLVRTSSLLDSIREANVAAGEAGHSEAGRLEFPTVPQTGDRFSIGISSRSEPPQPSIRTKDSNFCNFFDLTRNGKL